MFSTIIRTTIIKIAVYSLLKLGYKGHYGGVGRRVFVAAMEYFRHILIGHEIF